jgi:hypothetical protein
MLNCFEVDQVRADLTEMHKGCIEFLEKYRDKFSGEEYIDKLEQFIKETTMFHIDLVLENYL